MSPPRFPVASVMFGIIMVAIPIALVVNRMNGHAEMVGEVGLWPGLVAFGSSSFAIFRRRGQGSAFLWGFSIIGWTSLLAYTACSVLRPGIVDRAISHYLNETDCWWIVWLIDSNSTEGYILNLLTMGLYLAIPQLMMAAVGGLIARWRWGIRWTTT